MRTFIPRLCVVFVAAFVIVAGMSALQDWSPTARFFSKDGGSHTASDSRSAPGLNDRVTPAIAETQQTKAGVAGDESVHTAEDKNDFELWPDLTDTQQLLHALQIMIPMLGIVVTYDVIQRRRRNATRFAALKSANVGRVMTAPTVLTERRQRRSPDKRRPLSRALVVDITVDTILLVGFISNESFRLTGLVIHEWVGAALAVALVTHVTLHWNWVSRTTRRLLAKPAGRDTLRWGNDLALMFAMTICVASGLFSSRVVLPFFGIAQGRSDYWLEVHLWSARFCLFFVALHVALSWRWILTTISRLPFPRFRKATR